jgi:hypothetical protein
VSCAVMMASLRSRSMSSNTIDQSERRVGCYGVGALDDSLVRQATTRSQMIQARMRT